MGTKKINDKHPRFIQKLTLGQRAADFILLWVAINTILIIKGNFDPYPFILLNLVLSCLAAIQAPIILMAQNRQAERDRLDAKYDYAVNRKAEREIQNIQWDLDEIKNLIKKTKK